MSIERSVVHSLDSFWKYYESGEFDAGMSTLSEFGITQDVIDFTFNPDSYYVPNKQGDTFIKPHGVDEDAIPIIGLEDTNTYRFERPSFHSLQRIALRNVGIELGRIEQAFSTASDTLSSSGGPPGSASIFTRRAHIDDTPLVIESKPIVLFNTEREKDDFKLTCPGIILHELIHVAQCLNEPCINSGSLLQKELEAYAVQSCLVYSYVIPYSMGTAMAGEVEMFRKHNLGENEYTPTKEFTAALLQNDLLKKIVKD